MIDWIMNNLATLIISAVLIAIVALVVIIMVRDKKNGKSSCGCSCGSCPMSGKCHSKK